MDFLKIKKRSASDIDDEYRVNVYEYLLGPLLALIAPFIILKLLGASFDIKLADAVIGLIIYFTATSITSFRREKANNTNISNRFDKIERALDGNMRVVMLDDDDTHARLNRSLHKSLAVRNTFIGMKGLYGNDELRNDRIINHYRTILTKRGGIWEDIVGVGEFFDARFSELHKESFDMPGQHRVSILASHTPVINFILCGPQDGDFSEVYFGWVRVTGVDVFYSRDTNLVRMFDRYFDQLKSRPSRIIEELQTPDRLEGVHDFQENGIKKKSALDAVVEFGSRILGRSHNNQVYFAKDSWLRQIMGIWISVDGPAKSIEDVFRYTIISISYDKELSLIGEIRERKSGRKVASFNSTSTLLLKKSIVYTYRIRHEYRAEPIDGIAIYNMDEDGKAMRGYFVREKIESSEILRAVKIDSEALSDIDAVISRIIMIPEDSGVDAAAKKLAGDGELEV